MQNCAQVPPAPFPQKRKKRKGKKKREVRSNKAFFCYGELQSCFRGLQAPYAVADMNKYIFFSCVGRQRNESL